MNNYTLFSSVHGNVYSNLCRICTEEAKLNNRTHDSESQGQEEASHTQQTSASVTGSTTLKISKRSKEATMKAIA